MTKKGRILKVDPIRDPLKIEEMKKVLKEEYSMRDYVLFICGINLGMRITDLLRVKIKEFNKPHIIVREEKTDKVNKFLINKEIRAIVLEYAAGKDPEGFLFAAANNKKKPISRQYAHRILKEAGLKCGLDNVGTHSMRKTFGYFYYKHTKDVARLQDIFNHSAPSVTKRYIGITREEIDESLDGFTIGL
jgi:integrase